MKKIYTILALTICLYSCKKDKFFITDPNVYMHYEAFKNEAKNRNIKLPKHKLKGFILEGSGSVLGSNGLPAAAYYDHSDKMIHIDTTTGTYKTNLEVLIFHELGHALLGRGHKDDMFNLLVPKSIMNGKSLPEYQNALFKREYYINELFNPDEPKPWWI